MDRAVVNTAWGRASESRAGAHRLVRVTRGVLASSIAVLAAVAVHVAAGGATPSPTLLVTVLVLSWLPGVVLIGVAVRLWRQVAVIAIAEAMLHGVLALQIGAVPSRGVRAAESLIGGVAGMGGMGGMAGARATGWSHETSVHLIAAAPMAHGAAMTGWMWAGHAAAAAVTVLLWRRGEADLARLVALAARGLGRVTRVPGPARLAAPAVALPIVAEPLKRAIDAVRTAHPRRGPPLPA